MSSAARILKLLSLLGVLYHANCEWIDLSYTYNSDETLTWGPFTRFQKTPIWNGPIKVGNATIPYFTISDITTSEHAGTHMDAPVHVVKGKWSVDQIPTKNLVGDAVVVDISAKSANDSNAQMTVDDLKKWEDENGPIPVGSILFVFTGWGKFWPNMKNYLGTDTNDTSLYRFPGVHKNASEWLVKERNISGVGIDTASIDYGKSKTVPSHRILYGNNIYGLENVANLDQLPASGYMAYAFPMKIGGGSGGPVRIMATKKTSGVNGVGMICASGIFAVLFVAIAMIHVI